MGLLTRVRWWLRAKFEPEDVASDIEAEIQFHLEMRTRSLEHDGLDREAARREAARRFGNVERVRSECRRLSMMRSTGKGDPTMTVWLNELRYALRSLSKTPGFSIVVLLTLALGIGANSAIFTVVEGVLLRSLPFGEPDQIVMVWQNDRLRGTDQELFSLPDFFDVRERNDVFDRLAFFQTPSMTLSSDGGEPARVNATWVSAEFFDVLKVAPATGRVFYPEEDRPGGDRVAVLSHHLWMSRFGGDPNVLGARVTLDGASTEIVGVMPPRFRYPDSAELYVPSQLDATSRPRGNHGFTVVARLAPETSVERATQNVATIARALEAEFTDDNEGRGMWVESIYESVTGGVRTPLLVLLGAVMLVLLIACINVANLLFARALSREQELAIRSAVGAGRRALLRQSLTETMLLALIGGVLGLGLAHLGLGALLSIMPESLPRMDGIGLNRTVIGFAFALSLVSGAIVGLLPIATLNRRNLINSLREGTGSGHSTRTHRLRAGLAVAEIAGAVVLVVGAGLLVTSFSRLLDVSPGFSPNGVTAVDVQLPASRYPQGFEIWPNLAEVRQFHEALLERASETPGFDSVALAAYGPLDAGFTSRFTIEGREAVDPGQQDEVRIRVVSPGYFRTVGVRILAGRPLEPSDQRPEAPPVIAVNASFAERYFVDEEPIGARLTQWGLTREIVAVVEDVKFRGLAAGSAPAIYPLFSQAPFAGFSLLVKSDSAPELVYQRMRELIWDLDDELALTGFSTLDDELAASLASERFTMTLFSLFAVLALLLAGLGIYGVISYSVGQRQREIGVRMSFGASRSDVVALVLRDGAKLALIGVALGVVGAAFASRAIQSLLFGVERLDLTTFAVVGVLAIVVSLAASAIPSLRAARVDPISTLRHG